MSDAVIRELIKGQLATIEAVVAVAGQFAETLVSKGILSVAEAQATLSNIAEELRGDGDLDSGKTARVSYSIANDIDQRAISLAKKFGKD